MLDLQYECIPNHTLTHDISQDFKIPLLILYQLQFLCVSRVFFPFSFSTTCSVCTLTKPWMFHKTLYNYWKKDDIVRFICFIGRVNRLMMYLPDIWGRLGDLWWPLHCLDQGPVSLWLHKVMAVNITVDSKNAHLHNHSYFHEMDMSFLKHGWRGQGEREQRWGRGGRGGGGCCSCYCHN